MHDPDRVRGGQGLRQCGTKGAHAVSGQCTVRLYRLSQRRPGDVRGGMPRLVRALEVGDRSLPSLTTKMTRAV